MTSEMVVEELNNDKIKILKKPFLEGVIVAVTFSEQGMSSDEVVNSVPKREF